MIYETNDFARLLYKGLFTPKKSEWKSGALISAARAAFCTPSDNPITLASSWHRRRDVQKRGQKIINEKFLTSKKKFTFALGPKSPWMPWLQCGWWLRLWHLEIYWTSSQKSLTMPYSKGRPPAYWTVSQKSLRTVISVISLYTK